MRWPRGMGGGPAATPKLVSPRLRSFEESKAENAFRIFVTNSKPDGVDGTMFSRSRAVERFAFSTSDFFVGIPTDVSHAASSE